MVYKVFFVYEVFMKCNIAEIVVFDENCHYAN